MTWTTGFAMVLAIALAVVGFVNLWTGNADHGLILVGIGSILAMQVDSRWNKSQDEN